MRLAFLVKPHDANQLRQAIEASTCTWGGRYNIILPAYRRTPKRWVKGVRRQPPWKDVLAGYLRTFEPDIVVPLDGVDASGMDLEEERVAAITDVFGSSGDFGTSIGLSAMHIYRHLYEREFQFERRHPQPVIVPRVSERAMRMFIAVCFGAFPTQDQHRYAPNYREALGATEEAVAADTFPRLLLRHLTPLKVAAKAVRAFPLWDRKVRLLLVDGTAWGDLVDFWNLRAFNPRVFPLPKQWLGDTARSYAELFGDADVQLLAARTTSRSELEHAAKVYRGHSGGQVIMQSWYPRIWETRDRWQRDHPQAWLDAGDDWIEQPVDRGSVSFGVLAPPFRVEPYAIGGPRWANVINVRTLGHRDDWASVFPHDLRAVDKLVRSFGMRKAFSSSEGIVVRANWERERTTWTLPDGLALFRTWALQHGQAAELSDAGRLAVQILRAVGSPIGAAMIAETEIVEMIDKLNRPTEVAASIAIGDVRNVLRPIFQGNKARIEGRMEKLAEHVFRLGLKQRCPTCSRMNWYPLSDIREELECEQCLSPFAFPLTKPPLKDAWCYRTYGPFSVAKYGKGAFCVALALRFFCLMSGDATWWPSVELTGAGAKREMDFGLWYKDHATHREPPFLVVGECKTFDRFRAKDLKRARELATILPGAALVFGTLRKSLDADEKQRLSALARWGRRRRGGKHWNNPVLVLTAHELTGFDSPPHCWRGNTQDFSEARDLVSAAPRFLELAVGLQRAHLGLEPDDDWFHIRAHL